MAREEIHTEDLTSRLFQAGSEILAMNTGLTKDEAHALIVTAARRVLPEFGLRAWPVGLPLETRYRFVQRTQAFIGEELRARGFSAQTAGQVIHDLDAFYRGVRGITD